jgi:hypothetical protein
VEGNSSTVTGPVVTRDWLGLNSSEDEADDATEIEASLWGKTDLSAVVVSF